MWDKFHNMDFFACDILLILKMIGFFEHFQFYPRVVQFVSYLCCLSLLICGSLFWLPRQLLHLTIATGRLCSASQVVLALYPAPSFWNVTKFFFSLPTILPNYPIKGDSWPGSWRRSKQNSWEWFEAEGTVFLAQKWELVSCGGRNQKLPMCWSIE